MGKTILVQEENTGCRQSINFENNRVTFDREYMVKAAPGILAGLAVHSCVAVLVLVLSLVLPTLSFSDETDIRRTEISLSIFPRIVAVDKYFKEKLGKENTVKLLFVYETDENYANILVKKINLISGNIGGVIVTSGSVNSNIAFQQEDNLATAYFITERLNDKNLKKLMKYAEKNSRLVFSPFSGDVERGVTVGISVTSRVKPFFNLSVLKRSGVEINPMLIKMSKQYD